MIVQFCIPINGLYENKVFHKEIYFSCETCPTREQVEAALLPLNDHPDFRDCLNTVRIADGQYFPSVNNFVTQSLCFINHPFLGQVQISAKVIQPIQL